MTRRGLAHGIRTTAAIGLAALLCAGCATDAPEARQTAQTQMLTEAGFKMRPADTPKKQAQLAALPPHKLVARPGKGGAVGYIYADRDGCDCVYIGDGNAYRAYTNLVSASDRKLIAEMDSDPTFDWGVWASPSDDTPLPFFP